LPSLIAGGHVPTTLWAEADVAADSEQGVSRYTLAPRGFTRIDGAGG
jgi:hypothetical protein